LVLLFFVTVFVFVVVKELMGYGNPYSKSLNTQSAVEEKGYGAARVSSYDDEFDEAEYRAYREELAAYDDFVASLDMDD
jgi:hypothetical protein